MVLRLFAPAAGLLAWHDGLRAPVSSWPRDAAVPDAGDRARPLPCQGRRPTPLSLPLSRKAKGGDHHHRLGVGWLVGQGKRDLRPMARGVMAARRAAAPPVRRRVGWPEGRFTTPRSRQNTPLAEAGAERLGRCLLGGEAAGIGGDAGAPAPPIGARALLRREDAVEEPLTVAGDGHLGYGGCR